MSQESAANAAAESAAPTEVVESQNPEQSTPPEAKKSEDFLAPKFAALTRKEKQVREMERAIKAQQAEVEKMRTEWETKTKSSQESEAQLLQKLKKNPLKTLAEHGITYEQLMEMQLNDENPTPQMLVEQMRAEIKAEMEEKYGKLTETLKQKEEREATERYEAAVMGYKAELNTFVEQNSEKFELIVANNATDLMFEVAESFYQQTGKVPSHEDVAKAVEEHLEEEAKKIFKLKKFSTAQKQEAKPETKNSETAPTLSNTLAAEVPKSGKKLLTDEESKREAAKLIRWQE